MSAQVIHIREPEYEALATPATSTITGVVSSHITGSRTDIWLDVQQSSGPLRRWPINHTYGRPEAIAQEIIEAFTCFRVTQNNGYLC